MSIDSLVQDYGISIADALEILQSFAKVNDNKYNSVVLVT